MCRNVLLCLCLLLTPIAMATAETREPEAREPAAKKTAARKTAGKKSPAAESSARESSDKELSGMSIVGNDEAPKALYIVPWKSSEIGMEASMNMMLDERAAPVDRDVFMRQLDFYEVSTKK